MSPSFGSDRIVNERSVCAECVRTQVPLQVRSVRYIGRIPHNTIQYNTIASPVVNYWRVCNCRPSIMRAQPSNDILKPKIFQYLDPCCTLISTKLNIIRTKGNTQALRGHSSSRLRLSESNSDQWRTIYEIMQIYKMI